MGDNTRIEWSDATWNPVTGCTAVSPGCDHCYAQTLAQRFQGTPGHYYERGFAVQLRPHLLDQPLRWTRPRRIFVNSMSDLFHDSVPTEYIARVWSIMALAPRHTFQILTKRPARMHSLLTSDSFPRAVHQQLVTDRTTAEGRVAAAAVLDALDRFGDRSPASPLPNVWLGVSAENQKWVDIRIPQLRATPAAVRFVSAEPMLSRIRLCACGSAAATTRRRPNAGCPVHSDTRLDWVIAGGESGTGARPMHPVWARGLRDECAAAEVAFTFKQWGAWAPDPAGTAYVDTTGELHSIDDLTTSTVPEGWERIRRVGKKNAGRTLDGKVWDHAPTLGIPAGGATTS